MRLDYQKSIHPQHLRTAICTVFLLGLFGRSVGFAQDAGSSPPDDTAAANQKAPASELAAIRSGSQAFVAAFNKRDAKAIAALWTKKGEYIDDTGRRVRRPRCN